MSTGEFEHPECSFRYPENWKLDTAETGELAVTVESPDGGFWTLQGFGPVDPLEVAEKAKDAMMGEYDQIEYEEVDEEQFGYSMVGYNLDFYCLDLVIEARIRAMRVAGNAYMIMYQAEDRDFQNLLPVFGAITKTLTDSFEAR